MPQALAFSEIMTRLRRSARNGERLRVLARGTMNSALVEFEDGVRHIVSRNAFRKVKAA